MIGIVSSRLPLGGAVSVIASGLDGPFGVAIDSAGDFIVTDSDGARLVKVTPGGTVSVIATSGLGTLFAVAIEPTPDADGDGDRFDSTS